MRSALRLITGSLPGTKKLDIQYIYICSTQSENLRDLQIALRNLRILRTEANLQIACAICRLRNNARARSEDAAGTAVL